MNPQGNGRPDGVGEVAGEGRIEALVVAWLQAPGVRQVMRYDSRWPAKWLLDPRSKPFDLLEMNLADPLGTQQPPVRWSG
jgi:hypothetical protein